MLLIAQLAEFCFPDCPLHVGCVQIPLVVFLVCFVRLAVSFGCCLGRAFVCLVRLVCSRSSALCVFVGLAAPGA